MKYNKRKKRPINKKVRNATPLEYYGKQFKSKLELYCYKKLKEANLNFTYEEHKYELVPSFKFKNNSWELYKRKGLRVFGKQRPLIRSITYTPDFVGKEWIIETKGNPNDAFPLRWKLFKKYIMDKKINIDLYMPRNQKQIDETIKIIKDKYTKQSHVWERDKNGKVISSTRTVYLDFSKKKK